MSVQDHLRRNALRCFMRFRDRAERMDAEQLVDTFVSVGPLSDILENTNHQIIFGRRGTGKTHALKYFFQRKSAHGDIPIYIDCQNIGSNQSIYDDVTLPIEERGTRLLIDVVSSLHFQLLNFFSDPQQDWDLSIIAPRLDALVESLCELRVHGSVEREERESTQRSSAEAFGVDVTIASHPSAQVRYGESTNHNRADERRRIARGAEYSWINFGFLGQRLRQIAEFTPDRRIWILIDEWSTIPVDIQPYLADLIRRTLFNIPNVSGKIAAIEHRSRFKLDRESGQYIGFELGADITSSLNLDDYMVFENSERRAESFFRSLIAKHVKSIAEHGKIDVPRDEERLLNATFTQANVFKEFVKATEGVPRDAMHILSLAAQRAAETPISMPTLRSAAYSFFQSDKYNAIQSNPINRAMLDWIREEVIGNRRTRAFLLPVGTNDHIIDRLFDLRALHILKKNISSAHRRGERFVVYKLDYGCYVELANTQQYPLGMLVTGEPELIADFDVPDDDARSYRRAILDLKQFYERPAAAAAVG